MFFKNIIDIATKFKLKNFITPQLDFLTNLYAIAIYTDGLIQMEELVETKILLRKIIINENKDTDKEKIKEIVEFYFLSLKEELHKYQSEPGYFELQKMKLENQINYISKQNLNEILLIFKADQDFSYDERELYEKIKKRL